MARLEAIAKALYYPTPLRVVAGIAPKLVPPKQGKIRLLDPCAGRGSAALLLARMLGGCELYGIELDKERGEAAKASFDHFFCFDALKARVQDNSFDLLFHNPPYDDSGDDDKRLEHAFLKRMAYKLKPGGVLIHIVPQNRLTVSVKTLALHFEKVRIWRFPEPEYNRFNQVVLIGVRRKKPEYDYDLAAYIRFVNDGDIAQLPELSNCPEEIETLADGLPQLPEVVEEKERVAKQPFFHDSDDLVPAIYQLTGSVAGSPIFTSGEYSPEEAIKEARAAGVWTNKSLRDWAHPRSGISSMRPLVEPRIGQAALLAASGLFNNLTLKDRSGDPVLVKGTTYKEYVYVSSTLNDKGQVTSDTEKEVVRTKLTLLHLETGAVEVIEQKDMPKFVQRYGESISQKMLENFPPLYIPLQPDPVTTELEHKLHKLRRKPKGAQARATVALAYSLMKNGFANAAADPGVGKTYMAASAAYLAGLKRVVVVCPPHLPEKWKREIEITVPGAEAVIVHSMEEMALVKRRIQIHELTSPSPFFVILSRTRMRDSHAWRPISLFTKRGYPICPRCGSKQMDEEDLPVNLMDGKKHNCQKCNEPLWQAQSKRPDPKLAGILGIDTTGPFHKCKRDGPRRIALADYISKKMPQYFDLCVIDEAHEMKEKGSGQGVASSTLANACKRVIVLTGTYAGGYASNVFYLLWRFSRKIREEFGLEDEGRFIHVYGKYKRVSFRSERDTMVIENGAFSDRRKYVGQEYHEIPGLMPTLLMLLLDHSVFLKLTDVVSKEELPSYKETIKIVPMEGSDIDPNTMAGQYKHFESDLRKEVAIQLRLGSKKLLGTMMHSLLSWPDNPTKSEFVFDKGRVIASTQALPYETIYPKEQALVEWVKENRARGRKMLVFVSNTGVRDIIPRLQWVLAKTDAVVEVLRSETVKAEKREAWLQKHPCDVLIVNPRCVQTGLDLLEYPAIMFYQIDFSTYVNRQAKKRSYRVGTTEDVEVTYLVYSGTTQHPALSLIAKKEKASTMLEGELGNNGLYDVLEAGDEEGYEMLAKQLASGKEEKLDVSQLEALLNYQPDETSQNLTFSEATGGAIAFKIPEMVQEYPKPKIAAPAPSRKQLEAKYTLEDLRKLAKAMPKTKKEPVADTGTQLSLF